MSHGTPPTIPGEPVVDGLRQRLRGAVLAPGDPEFEGARRVWNGMIDRRPALIARCHGAADVMAAVRFARERSLPVSVRGGGHNVSGRALCQDGLVIDLSPMRGVRVDPRSRTVRAGGGARLGDIDHETQAFGLATPLGAVSATGVGGIALHGGMGFLTRKHGLTADNLIAADLVTADGRLLAVDDRHHPDLLWALRGGGGSFGVVTSFEFRLHPVGPEVWFALVLYPVDRHLEVLRFFRDFMAQAPDELMGLALYWSAPDGEPIPVGQRGAPVIVLAACWCGPVEEGERAVRPLREVTAPIADLSGRMPFVAAQRLFDPDYPDGRRYYWKSLFLRELGDDVIAALGEYAGRRPSPISSVDVWALGGAMGRVDPRDSAFFQRESPYLLGIEANWEEPAHDDANVGWARGCFEDARRFSPGGSYLNFPGFLEEGEGLLRQTFGANYDRLRAIKSTYDPADLFSSGLGIPAGA